VATIGRTEPASMSAIFTLVGGSSYRAATGWSVGFGGYRIAQNADSGNLRFDHVAGLDEQRRVAPEADAARGMVRGFEIETET
jgi:hypothetical protein